MNKDSVFMVASLLCDGISCPYYKEHAERIFGALLNYATDIKGLSFVDAMKWIVDSDMKETCKEMDEYHEKQSEDDRSIFC